jgi:hypothetical protein
VKMKHLWDWGAQRSYETKASARHLQNDLTWWTLYSPTWEEAFQSYSCYVNTNMSSHHAEHGNMREWKLNT